MPRMAPALSGVPEMGQQGLASSRSVANRQQSRRAFACLAADRGGGDQPERVNATHAAVAVGIGHLCRWQHAVVIYCV